MINFSAINIRTWAMAGASGTLGIAMYELAKNDPDFAVVTSDLCFFSGLDHVMQDFPDKVYNVGIAEQNMIGIAAGMAKEGMHVWATTYASFASTRAIDQVKVNMGYMKLPIKLIGLTSGFSVGVLGATHMAIEDIAIMRAIPNITILSPADCHEAMKLLLAASKINSPVYIRLSGTIRTPIVYSSEYNLEIGKANCILSTQNADIMLISTGSMVNVAINVAKTLAEQNIKCDLYDIHMIKPLDNALIANTVKYKLVVTLEEHNIIGGLGSAVAEQLSQLGNAPKQVIIAIEDNYPHAASYEALLRNNGLTINQITEKILKSLNTIQNRMEKFNEQFREV